MTDTLNRRQVFAGTVVAAAVPMTAVAAVAVADPILDLIERYGVLWPLCPGDDDEAGNIRWNAEITRLEAEIAETMPTTRAGALAVVRFVGKQVHCFSVDPWMARALAASADILARQV